MMLFHEKEISLVLRRYLSNIPKYFKVKMFGCGSSLNDWMLSGACVCEASSIIQWIFSGEKYVASYFAHYVIQKFRM